MKTGPAKDVARTSANENTGPLLEKKKKMFSNFKRATAEN